MIVLMFGTNDVGVSDPSAAFSYASNMWRIVDALTAQGVIPLMSTIPPRGDNAAANARVPCIFQFPATSLRRMDLTDSRNGRAG